jgi:hypothetical protein
MLAKGYGCVCVFVCLFVRVLYVVVCLFVRVLYVFVRSMLAKGYGCVCVCVFVCLFVHQAASAGQETQAQNVNA